MEDGEALIAQSDYQGNDHDEYRMLRPEENYHTSYFNFKDDYSDIYFDRNYGNWDNISLWNGSNFPKEINLEMDQWSDDEHPETNLHQLRLKSRLCSRGSFGQPNFELYQLGLDDEESLIPKNLSPIKNQKFDTSVDNNQKEKEQELISSNYDNPIVSGDYQSNESNLPSFNKNEGKLVFKITRFNRTTQKEKLITKNRRIISKCPHTSMKYYAKGMCKKCYHSFGREKKAFICGHSDKPLYAKGYCKQCYLAKYKEKIYTNSGVNLMSKRKKQQSTTSVPNKKEGLNNSNAAPNI